MHNGSTFVLEHFDTSQLSIKSSYMCWGLALPVPNIDLRCVLQQGPETNFVSSYTDFMEGCTTRLCLGNWTVVLLYKS